MAKTYITSGTGASQTLDAIQNEKVPVYSTRAAAEADLANIEEGAIVATKDTGATEKVVDVVQDGNMNPVTSNAVYDAIDGLKLKNINVVNSETALDVATRIAHIITQYCVLSNYTYIGVATLSGYDYGAINVVNILDRIRGTFVIEGFLYICSGTLSNPNVTRIN